MASSCQHGRSCPHQRTMEGIMLVISKYETLAMGFPGDSDGKESACNTGDLSSIPGLGRFSWGREWQPTPAFLPGEFQGQRSLAGYSSWDHKESDMTKWLRHIEDRGSRVSSIQKGIFDRFEVKSAIEMVNFKRRKIMNLLKGSSSPSKK